MKILDDNTCKKGLDLHVKACGSGILIIKDGRGGAGNPCPVGHHLKWRKFLIKNGP